LRIKDVRAVLVDLTPRPRTQARVPRVPTDGFHAPMSRYPEIKRKGGPGFKRVACVVTADDGTWGFGMTVHGGPVASIINDHLAPALRGEPCMATEKHWDVMRRMTEAYGNEGLASYAMSAVDIALWDLKGRLLGTPVYELLGGPQKDRVFCYASNTMLDYGMENSLEWFLELGFRAVKIFLLYGPEHGLEGLRRDVDRVARARQIVGDDVELAVDGWMSLDVEYTVRLAQELRPYRIKWLEDYLPPTDFEGYARVRRRVPHQTLSSGEHWYGTAPFATACREGLVDILQPDISWCGGLTNAVKICHIAEAYGLSVIAHAGMNTPFGQHLSMAMPAIAWGERSEGVSPPGVPLEEMVLLPGTPVIKGGYLVPSEAPGFGLEITREWLEEAARR
jgi:L-rhamnonate dehydratase